MYLYVYSRMFYPKQTFASYVKYDWQFVVDSFDLRELGNFKIEKDLDDREYINFTELNGYTDGAIIQYIKFDPNGEITEDR